MTSPGDNTHQRHRIERVRALLAEQSEIRTALCVCPDLGRNYVDTLYHDGWLRNHLGRAATELAKFSLAGHPVTFRRSA